MSISPTFKDMSPVDYCCASVILCQYHAVLILLCEDEATPALVDDMEVQFQTFKSSLEAILNTEDKITMFREETMPILCERNRRIWSHLLQSNFNLKIAKYLKSFGAPYSSSHPDVFADFLKSHHCWSVGMVNYEVSQIALRKWRSVFKRKCDIISWFVEELGITLNDEVLIRKNSISAKREQCRSSIFHSFCFALPATRLAGNSTFRMLLNLGGDIFSVASTETINNAASACNLTWKNIGRLDISTVFDYICNSVINPLHPVVQLDDTIIINVDTNDASSLDASTSAAIVTPHPQSIMNIDAWMTLARFASLRDNAVALVKEDGVTDLVVQDLILPNGVSMLEAANEYSISKDRNRSNDLMRCCDAGADLTTMMVLKRIGVISIEFFNTNSPEMTSLVESCLRCWSAGVLNFLTGLGINLPMNALDTVRPDQYRYLLFNLGKYGVCKEIAAQMHSLSARRR